MGKNGDDVRKIGKMPPWDTYVAGIIVIVITLILVVICGTRNSNSPDRYSIFIEPPYNTTLKDLCNELESSDTTRNRVCDSLCKVINAMSPSSSDSNVVVQVFRESTNGISFIKDRKGSSQFTISLAFFLFPLAVLVIWYIGLVYVKDRLRVHDRNEALRREIYARQDVRRENEELENENKLKGEVFQLCKELKGESDMDKLKKAEAICKKLNEWGKKYPDQNDGQS